MLLKTHQTTRFRNQEGHNMDLHQIANSQHSRSTGKWVYYFSCGGIQGVVLYFRAANSTPLKYLECSGLGLILEGYRRRLKDGRCVHWRVLLWQESNIPVLLQRAEGWWFENVYSFKLYHYVRWMFAPRETCVCKYNVGRCDVSGFGFLLFPPLSILIKEFIAFQHIWKYGLNILQH